jgi:hypothetical protein
MVYCVALIFCQLGDLKLHLVMALTFIAFIDAILLLRRDTTFYILF